MAESPTKASSLWVRFHLLKRNTVASDIISKTIDVVLRSAKIPMDEGRLAVFSELEKLLSNACLITIQNGIPFQVDTDTSDYAIAAIQSQGDRRLPINVSCSPESGHPTEKHYEGSHYQCLSC